MFKKIIIPSLAFLGMSLMAFYTAKLENRAMTEEKEIENTVYQSPVVLELFTSQGCSSCPPADVLLDKVKKEYPNEVFALSYHVDYWNYIGWEDPFSKSVYTKKQRDYNRKFQYRSNYTPQLVVNGKEHFVGSNGLKLYGKIESYKTGKSKNSLQLLRNESFGKEVSFDFEVEGTTENRLLRAVLVLDERTTSVKRGENRNRTLKNSNIVVAEKYITLDGDKGTGEIAIPELVSQNDELTLILLIEKDNLDITAAAKTPIGA